MPTVHIPQRLEARGPELNLPFLTVIGFDSSRRKRVGLGEHSHEGHELTFLFDGEVTWETDRGESLHLTGGDLAVTQPSVVHRGRLDLIQPSSFFWTVVDLRRPGCGLLTASIRLALHRRLAQAGNTVRFAGEEFPRELARLHEDLAGLGRTFDPLVRAAVRARIATVLLCSAAILAQTGRRPQGDCSETARSYISGNLTDPDLSVSRVARHAGVSVSRLHAVFKQRTGLTPNDYIQRQRVDRAVDLLRTTDTPITRIALELGFGSSQYFATCFRKYAGTSPGAIRRDTVSPTCRRSRADAARPSPRLPDSRRPATAATKGSRRANLTTVCPVSSASRSAR